MVGEHPRKDAEYLDGSYFRPELEKHLVEYRKVIPDLTVFDQGMNANKISQQQQQINDLQRSFEDISKRLEGILKPEE